MKRRLDILSALTNSDGSMRKTTKSDLKDKIVQGMMPCSIEEVQFNTVIIDLIPLFHQLTALPNRSPLVKVMDILIGLIRKIYAPHKMKRIDVIKKRRTKCSWLFRQTDNKVTGFHCTHEFP